MLSASTKELSNKSTKLKILEVNAQEVDRLLLSHFLIHSHV